MRPHHVGATLVDHGVVMIMYLLLDFNRCEVTVDHCTQGLHDVADLANLSKDLVMLTMEKDPNKKSFFAGKLEIMAVSLLVAILGVFLLLYFLNKKKSNNA